MNIYHILGCFYFIEVFIGVTAMVETSCWIPLSLWFVIIDTCALIYTCTFCESNQVGNLLNFIFFMEVHFCACITM